MAQVTKEQLETELEHEIKRLKDSIAGSTEEIFNYKDLIQGIQIFADRLLIAEHEKQIAEYAKKWLDNGVTLQALYADLKNVLHRDIKDGYESRGTELYKTVNRITGKNALQLLMYPSFGTWIWMLKKLCEEESYD